MTTLRSFVSIVGGYLLYSLASMFLLTTALADSGVLQVVIFLCGLAFISLLTSTFIIVAAEKATMMSFYIVAGLIVIASAANLSLDLGAEPDWYKIATMLIVAPGVVLAGIIYRKTVTISRT